MSRPGRRLSTTKIPSTGIILCALVILSFTELNGDFRALFAYEGQTNVLKVVGTGGKIMMNFF